jgi:zinc/manganese transport system permease protein
MIGAPATARSLTDRPPVAMGLSVAVALVIVWASIAASYTTNYPVGFFVGTASAAAYACGRLYSAGGGRRVRAARREARRRAS